MVETDDKEEGLDLDRSDGDTGDDLTEDEGERTVIDTELGDIIRLAAEEDDDQGEKFDSAQGAVGDLGPAFPDEDSFVIDESGTPIEVIDGSSGPPTLGFPQLGAQLISSETSGIDDADDDWGGAYWRRRGRLSLRGLGRTRR